MVEDSKHGITNVHKEYLKTKTSYWICVCTWTIYRASFK